MIPWTGGDAAARAAAFLASARRLLVFTGSGMSRESNIPTFRDARDGLWARCDPSELATPAAFARTPARVFGWYVARWQRARAAAPHAGYEALARLEERFAEFVVVTQNVDGLHRRAGSREVVELHGSLDAFRCGGADPHPYHADRLRDVRPAPDGSVEPPRCDVCGALVRPGVVWFGEMLPADAVGRAWRAAQEAQVVLVIGTSGVVFPAAEVPLIARQSGARIIEINPDRTPLANLADLWWSEPAGLALPRLEAVLAETVVAA